MYNTLTNTNGRKRDPHYEGPRHMDSRLCLWALKQPGRTNTNFDISTAAVAAAKAENMEGLFHNGSFS